MYESLQITEQHPCFSERAHLRFGRVHLPIAPLCNIACGFCGRGIDKTEKRPGAYSEVLTPTTALDRVRTIVKKYDYITTIGIAGPGDPLANVETFETLKLVKEEFPSLMRCICTNGLVLPESIKLLKDVNLTALTVTVNAINSEISSQIIDHVWYKGEKIVGEKGSSILINNQLAGIQKAVEAGITTKVNTVLIPDINSSHVVDIAKCCSELGVTIMNIMPLIFYHKFKMKKVPSWELLANARAKCERYIKQFKSCVQCRADACGIPAFDQGRNCYEQ